MFNILTPLKNEYFHFIVTSRDNHMHSNLRMVHASSTPVLNLAPGMVLQDLKVNINYPMTLVVNLMAKEEQANNSLQE